MQKRLHAIYLGEVQGVGFRFTAQRFAWDLGIMGWVKNLDNGNVEIIIEGKEEALRQFMVKIKEYFRSYIQDVDVNWQKSTGEFSEFKIEL